MIALQFSRSPALCDYIVLQFIVNMHGVSISGMPSKGCLFLGTTNKLQIFVLFFLSLLYTCQVVLFPVLFSLLQVVIFLGFKV